MFPPFLFALPRECFYSDPKIPKYQRTVREASPMVQGPVSPTRRRFLRQVAAVTTAGWLLAFSNWNQSGV